MIGGMMAAMATPAMLQGQAQGIGGWAAWWERSKRFTLQIAEAMPPADYNYAPFGARTFGQLMQHIGQAEGFYLGRFGKGGAAPQPPQGDTSKAATIAYLNQLFDWSIGVVKQLTPADLSGTVAGGRGPAMTGLDLLLNAMVHTAHTRGYSDMYLRNKGVKPPTYSV
jgi:uncharacterized damage-inducible protein DinB